MTTETELDPLDKAMADAMICGTGVLKFTFTEGKIDCNHVPIKDFLAFGEELKARHDNTVDWVKR